MYEEGEGTEADKVKALMWFEKAAEQEQPGAGLLAMALKLGLFDDAMAADKAKDYKRALAIFEALAERGNVNAQFNCGIMYDHGEGTAVDSAKALTWFEKAAEQGYAAAQFNCGCMYHNGRGTAVDEAKALMWYKKAANQGLAVARLNGGILHALNGNMTMAEIWLEEAAEQTEDLATQRKAEGLLRDLADHF